MVLVLTCGEGKTHLRHVADLPFVGDSKVYLARVEVLPSNQAAEEGCLPAATGPQESVAGAGQTQQLQSTARNPYQIYSDTWQRDGKP